MNLHPMRIALFTLEYPPSCTGGLGIQVAALTHFLRSRGDQVDVYYLGDNSEGVEAIPLPLPSVKGLKNGVINPINIEGAQMVLLAHRNAPYDIAHCHDWHGIVHAAALWEVGVPVITTVHLPATSRFHYESSLSVREEMLLNHLALRISKKVIAVSRFTADTLEVNFRGYAHKIHIVHNGIDTEFFRPCIQTGDTEESPLILSVGRVVEQKGFEQLPEIFALVKRQTPEARLCIVGSGEKREEIRNDFRDRGLEDKVSFLSFTDQRRLREYYRRARVLAMPSVFEPFGLVAVEAMSCGTPVVAYDAGGLKEIITNGKDGILVPPGDRLAFAEALSTIIAESQRFADMGRLARSTVLNRFSQKHSNEKTIGLYR